MWTEIRVIALLLTFMARLLGRRGTPRASGWLADGSALYVQTAFWRNQPARVGIAWSRADRFVIERRSWLHAGLQRVGITQAGIGDVAFDALAWLAEDDGSLRARLQRDDDARRAAITVFDDGFHRIEADRGVLWLAGRPARAQADALASLQRLRASLAAAVDTHTGPKRSAWRPRLVDSMAWAIVAYAAVALVESLVESPPTHLDYELLAGKGLLIGAGGLVVFVIGAILLLGRATRHGLAGVLPWLVLVTPVAGIQAAADLNRGFDRSAEVVVERTVVERVRHAGRYAFARHVIRFDPAAPGAHEAFAIPRTIGVGRRLYETVAPCDTAILTLGHGWLGVPWIRAIRIEPQPQADRRGDGDGDGKGASCPR